MSADGAHLQGLAGALIAAQRAGDDGRVRELAEELFDVGREMSVRERRPLGRRAMTEHKRRSWAAMMGWRMRQVFRRPIVQ